MPDQAKLKNGDQVLVFRIMGDDRKRIKQLEDPYPGTVTSAARLYGTVEYTKQQDGGKPTTYTIQVNLETGLERSGFPRFRAITPEQADREIRRDKAIETLAAWRITIDMALKPLTTEQLEQLAEVTRQWGTDAD